MLNLTSAIFKKRRRLCEQKGKNSCDILSENVLNEKLPDVINLYIEDNKLKYNKWIGGLLLWEKVNY